MMEGSCIPEEIRKEFDRLGPCDIVIGIPSYNHADSIGVVFQTATEGLKRAFPDQKILFVNSDGGSGDGTPEAARKKTDLNCLLCPYSVSPSDTQLNPYHGIPAKRIAVRSVMEISHALNAKACVLLSPDLISFKPEWMALLLTPILHDKMDLIVPSYQRHPYDGTITKGLVYPILRALFGKQVHQPIAGEMAMGNLFFRSLLDQPNWDSEVLDYGTDIWLVAQAMVHGAKIGQARLGERKQARGKFNVHLSSMLVQLIGSVFTLMEETFPVWKKGAGSDSLPEFGEPPRLELPPVSVRIDHMVRAFKLGIHEFFPLWEGILSENTIRELKKRHAGSDEPRFPDDVWVQMVYEFAVTHFRKTMSREHLIKSLTPLYLGWVASYILETRGSGPREAEEKIESLCLKFEEKKPELVKTWEEASPETGKSKKPPQ